MADKSQIFYVTNKHVDNLFKKWTELFDSNKCIDLVKKLEERVNSFFLDLMTESDEKELMIKADIKFLETELADIIRLLRRDTDKDEKPQDMPLAVWYCTLDKKVEPLREELKERQAEICELLLQQEELCEELDEKPLPLLADPLPKSQEISAFYGHLERLRTERLQRIDKLFQLRTQIKQDMKLLGLVPQSDEDGRLLSHANQSLTPNTMEKLSFMEEEFKAQVLEMRERIDDMRAKIDMLWERLPDADEFAKRRVREAQEYSQRTYDVLHEELQRCRDMRRHNLKSFIEQLRVELQKCWDLTLRSEQERKRFSHFFDQKYSEELLELHELELDNIRSFYNTNKKIFELFASRGEIWARMMALEDKANDPNRFNNRGGQLLKEERERKLVRSKLSKMEQQITELVQAYEQRNNSPFLVHGENILEYMANETKELQSSARKANQSNTTKVMPTLKSGLRTSHSPLSSKNLTGMSCSTMSLRQTPTNGKLSTATGTTAKSTGNLRKRKSIHVDNKAETSNAKRNLTSALNSIKPLSTQQLASQRLTAAREKIMKSPQKKVLVLNHTLRRGTSQARRSLGHRKPLKKLVAPKIRIVSPSSDESYESAPEDNYNTFEKHISPAARSSMMPKEFNSSYHEAKQRRRF